jgi:hypothetical protein
MAEIRITGFDGIERTLTEMRELVQLMVYRQKMQPEKDALMNCINAMQSAVESVILAYEELAGGETPVSKEARHAMNAAQMLKHQNGAVPWWEWTFPEEHSEQMFVKAARGESFAKTTRLVKKPAPAKKQPAKKKPRKK